MFTSHLSAQDLVGVWQNPQQGLTFQLNQDYTYQIKYANGASEIGQYGVQDGYLILQSNMGQNNTYYIQGMNATQLALTDANGMSYQFARNPQTQNFNPTKPINTNIGGKTIAESGGQTLKQGHIDVYVDFTQFIISKKLNSADKQLIIRECLESFKENPQALMQDANTTNQAMQQLYAIQDPVQIGMARIALLSEVHKASMQGNSGSSSITRLVQKHAPILAYDQSSGLALTEKDLNGLVNMLSFFNELGGGGTVTAQQKQTMAQQLGSNFYSLSLEEKQMLCMGSVLNNVMQAQWNRLSPQEKDQVVRQLQQQAPQQPASDDDWLKEYLGDNTYSNPKLEALQRKLDAGTMTQAEMLAYQNLKNQEMQMWNMMSNMQQQIHVTNMNIIENMGDGGGYWEIVDY